MTETLRSKLIRLAHKKPELRRHLLPMIKEARDLTDREQSWLQEAKAEEAYFKRRREQGLPDFDPETEKVNLKELTKWIDNNFAKSTRVIVKDLKTDFNNQLARLTITAQGISEMFAEALALDAEKDLYEEDHGFHYKALGGKAKGKLPARVPKPKDRGKYFRTPGGEPPYSGSIESVEFDGTTSKEWSVDILVWVTPKLVVGTSLSIRYRGDGSAEDETDIYSGWGASQITWDYDEVEIRG